VKTEKLDHLILTDGSFRFLLGVNYWPRLSNIRMWRDWNEDAVREDLRQMKDMGVRAARIFLKCEDFADEAGVPRPEAVEKLRKLLDLADEAGLGVFVTFLVGHMSGKNWPIPWTSFEGLYSPESVEKTCRFAARIAELFRDHPAVAGWILSNELSLVKRASSVEEALVLLKAFVQAIKGVDPHHVVSSGDIPDSYMQETPSVKHIVDYVGPHLYLYDTDSVRHGYMYAAMLELFADAGEAPVILEEFGFSTLQYSEESHAAFVNEVLYTALAHEASGAFVWCFSDFPSESDPPYEWRPLELGFGLLRKDGSGKPAAEVFRRFSSELEAVEKLGLNKEHRRVAHSVVVAPFYVFRDYEFAWYKQALGFHALSRLVGMGYTLLSASSTPARVVYEFDAEKAFGWSKLVVLPSAVACLASTWRKLLHYVEAGGVLYASFLRAVGGFQALHDSPTQLWEELFGVKSALEAGSVGAKLHGRLTLRVVEDIPPLSRGDRIALDVHEPAYTFRARPVDARVLAVREDGEPALFLARRGKGAAVLSLVPFEAVLAGQEALEWGSGVFELYEALALLAGIERPYVSSDSRVEVQTFSSPAGSTDIVITVNHSPGSIDAVLTARRSIAGVEKVGGDAEVAGSTESEVNLRMPGKSAVILHVEHAR